VTARAGDAGPDVYPRVRSRGRACSLALAIGVAGCAQSIDIGGHPDGSIDGSRGGPDSAPGEAGALDDVEGGAADGAVVDGTDGGAAPTCGSGPALAVGIVSTDTDVPASLVMFAVGPSAVRRCPDVTARGSLPTPQVIGWIDSERMIVANSAELAIVSTTGDHVIGARAHSESAVTVVDASGEAWGVATDTGGSGSIQSLRMLRARDLMPARVYAGGALYGAGCDASPEDPARVICVVGGVFDAATLRDPFLDAPAETLIGPSGLALVELDALGERIVWIERGAETDAIRGSVGGLRGSVGAPSACVSALCGTPFELREVVVDPTRPGGYFAICVGGTDRRRHVIRGSTEADGAACETILDGTEMPPALNAFSLDLRE
jgi:hypothetical protein